MFDPEFFIQLCARRFSRRAFGISLLMLFLSPFARSAAELPAAPRKPFRLILLPDTQEYANAGVARIGWPWKDTRSAIFYKQTGWIATNREALNIRMVAHVGDIVQSDFPAEWEVAGRAFQTLDDSGIPYAVCLGNHDMGFRLNSYEKRDWDTAVSRETRFNEYFTPKRFEKHPWYGGAFQKGVNDNYYCLAEAEGLKFLLIALEFKPRDEVLAWANRICKTYPDRRCILVTHMNLRPDRRLESGDTPDYEIKGNNGKEIWQKLTSVQTNIFLVLSGHYTGEAVLTSTSKSGNTVHQILADYQSWPNKGDGYLRILTFIPDEDRIEVQTYSPWIDRYQPTNNVSLHYDM